MNMLFYQLIFNVKTKRWFELLGVLEEAEQTTAPSLVEHTGFGRRTIMNDIKELKDYFGDTIQLIGDEKGYHFSFFDPQAYYQKKQALLAEERLFLFVDQLAAGKQLENYQWGYYLDIPVGSFSRIKHRLQEILLTHYDCQLVGKKNQLSGEEASIRQFLYDFYFTLPLYPNALADQVQQMQLKKTTVNSGQWQLDPTLFHQWLIITKLRVDQGHLLPEQINHLSQQTALASALDSQVRIFLPAREKAALFLLSIHEHQFLNPLVQKEFIRVFSLGIEQSFPIRETEGLVYRLFETLLLLMEHFFQLPRIFEQVTVGQVFKEKQPLLEALITRFTTKKNQYTNTIFVTYQLAGSASLKRWIKLEVMVAVQEVGLYLVEAPIFAHSGFVRHVYVTNQDMPDAVPAAVVLPEIPDKEAIRQAFSAFL